MQVPKYLKKFVLELLGIIYGVLWILITITLYFTDCIVGNPKSHNRSSFFDFPTKQNKK